MLPAPLEESASTAPLKARRRIGIGMLSALLAVSIAACGGGSRQDATEPSGDFPIAITRADFSSKQQLAQNSNLTLRVENTGNDSLPDLAITIFTTSNANTGGFFCNETTTTE